MKITYDKSVNAAYIYINGSGENKVHKSHIVNPKEVDGAFIVLDFDEEKKLIGIEVQGASNRLSLSALNSAEKIG